MEDRINQLIRNLKTLDVDLKKQSIDELATLGNEHAEAALHWAMHNDLDEDIQQYARAAYEKLHANSDDDSQGGISVSAPPIESKESALGEQPVDVMAADVASGSDDRHTVVTPADYGFDPGNSKPKSAPDLNDTSHMAVLEEIEEEPRNKFGDLSLKLAGLKIALMITLILLEAPFDIGEKLPVYVELVRIAGIITPFAGIIVAVLGLRSHLSRKFTSQAGLIANSFLAVLWFLRLITK